MWFYNKEAEEIGTLTHLETGAQSRGRAMKSSGEGTCWIDHWNKTR